MEFNSQVVLQLFNIYSFSLLSLPGGKSPKMKFWGKGGGQLLNFHVSCCRI